jgi:hypothetical protein
VPVRQNSIICTRIPGGGIPGVRGSHHPQYIDTVHREHAVVATSGVRTAKAMGLRNLPPKSWQVNKGRVIAANIAAWTRLLGLCADEHLQEADPDTLLYPHPAPSRQARPARSEPVRTWAHGRQPAATHASQTGTAPETGRQHNQ